MPFRKLKRHIPNQDVVRQHRFLKFLGDKLFKADLWHFNRRSVSKAFAIGLFCTWLPIPLQTVVAAIMALQYRANVPLSVALVFISNPFTMVPMFFGAYAFGSFILREEIETELIKNSEGLQIIAETFGQIWQPLVFGSVILGLISSVIGYLMINFIWRIWVQNRYKERKALRLKQCVKKQGKITQSVSTK